MRERCFYALYSLGIWLSLEKIVSLVSHRREDGGLLFYI
jgi:hypothetical protein